MAHFYLVNKQSIERVIAVFKHLVHMYNDHLHYTCEWRLIEGREGSWTQGGGAGLVKQNDQDRGRSSQKHFHAIVDYCKHNWNVIFGFPLV